MPAAEKGAIDCEKYPEGINFETHRVIAGQVTQAAMEDFIILKTKIKDRDKDRDTGNQADWDAYVAKHYDFGQPDDDDEN